MNFLTIIIIIFKILGITLSILIGLIFIFSIAPIWYKIDIYGEKSLNVVFDITIIKKFLYARFSMAEDFMIEHKFCIFGFSSFDKKKKEIKQKEKGHNKSTISKKEDKTKSIEEKEPKEVLKLEEVNETKSNSISNEDYKYKAKEKESKESKDKKEQEEKHDKLNIFRSIRYIKYLTNMRGIAKEKILEYLDQSQEPIIKELKEFPHRNQLIEDLKKLFINIGKTLLPKKVNIQTEIGFEDPATTGYVLGLGSIIYPYYKNKMKLTMNVKPNFNKKIFKGDIKIKGHFSTIQILIKIIKFLFSKSVRFYIKYKLKK